MKNTGKSLLAIALVLCLLLPLFASAENVKTYDKHIVFNVASSNINESVDYNQDELTQYFEKMFNFEWDLISLPSGAGEDEEKIRIWINSGDMPDVVIANRYHSGEMASYIEQGLIHRFPDDWKERWPNAAKAFELTVLGDATAEALGGTYVFPRAIFANSYPAEAAHVVPHYLAYIRKDWAQLVGFELKDAYTTSELMEFARLIKEKDPGQVGKRLVPIACEPWRLIYMFMLANSEYAGGADTVTQFYRDENGQYQWGPANDATLTGLKLYKQAYDEGLLHPEFYSYVGQEAQEDFYIAGIAGMMVSYGMASYMELYEKYLRENLGLEYGDVVHTAAILGDDGYYHGAELMNYAGYVMFSPDIEQETFERYLDLMDYAATDYGQLIIRLGFEGIDWEYGAEGELITHYAENESARTKYQSIYPIYHRLVIMSDDFSLINPSFKKVYRDRVASMYILKNQLASETSIAPIDWDVALYTSDAMSRISVDFGTEYATIILGDNDVETDWKNWVKSNEYLIKPVLEELNQIGK